MYCTCTAFVHEFLSQVTHVHMFIKKAKQPADANHVTMVKPKEERRFGKLAEGRNQS